MKQFASIEKLDTAILYTLELISSVSVLFLAVGLIASVANVLTGGEVISSNEIGKQFYAWSQAIGIDASIPGVILRLAICIKTKEWFRLSIYAILSALVLFTAFNISNVESLSQSLNKSLADSYASSLVSLDVLVTIRSLTVILLIVSHSLKSLQTEQTPIVKVSKPKKLFTLSLIGLPGKQGQTVQERVESLSGPRAEATEEGHASLGAGGAARAATDLTRNDQRAHTALRQIIV